MPALFETGFFVRKPAWHEQGIVLDYYPGREEAMKLAGHDFKVVERPIAVIGKPLTGDAVTGYGLHLAGVEYFDHLRGYRSQDSYVKRTLLADNPAKANLIKTIHEVVVA